MSDVTVAVNPQDADAKPIVDEIRRQEAAGVSPVVITFGDLKALIAGASGLHE